MSAFASNNEHFTPEPCEEIAFGQLFMVGFEGVNSMRDESDRELVSEADDCKAMECDNPTAPPYGEVPTTSLENCFWRRLASAADKCQEMPGTDPDCAQQPKSSTIKTRTAAGPRNVHLNLPVLLAFKGLTLEQTAKQLGVSATALKTHLRMLGIEDWRDFRKEACMHIAHVAHQAV